MLFDNQKLFLSYILYEGNEKMKVLKKKQKRKKLGGAKELRPVRQLDL